METLNQFAQIITSDEVELLVDIVDTFQSVLSWIGFLVAIYTIVAMWRIFTKAGQAGWKSLIPVYNEYVYLKVAGVKAIFWIRLVLTVLLVAFVAVFVNAMGNDNYELAGTMLMLFFLSLAVKAVLNVVPCFTLPVQFGISAAFGIGLWLLPQIFQGILAFNGKITYGKKQPQEIQ